MNFGTAAFATACTIFAPSFAMPPCSYAFPTMKPVMFWKKTRGTSRWQAISMKWVALSADSEKRTPLFARTATGNPEDVAESRDERRPVPRLELVEPRPVEDPREQLATSYGLRRSLGMTP